MTWAIPCHRLGVVRLPAKCEPHEGVFKGICRTNLSPLMRRPRVSAGVSPFPGPVSCIHTVFHVPVPRWSEQSLAKRDPSCGLA